MRSRNGTTNAGGTAALIGLIGLFIILYVLFLPQDIRQDLLEKDIEGYSSNSNTTNSNYAEWKEITRENPGRLDTLSIKDCIGRECSHDISSFMLYRTTNSAVIEESNPFIIKNNVMNKKFHEETFEIYDLANTKNIFLAFNTFYHQGVLTIKLNGNTIFEKEIDTFNPDPIELPSAFLARSNKLNFEVSPIKWKFWETNEYRVDNIKIIGDITDISKQSSNNLFYVSDSEYYNVERAKLRFSPDCNPGNVGVLQIVLNNREISSTIPDCSMLNSIEMPPTYIERGENSLTFKTEKGDYMIDLIEMKTYLDEITYPVYYFDVNEEDLEFIENDEANLTVTIEFVDQNANEFDNVKDRKYEAIVIVNGHKRYISTYDEEYDFNIQFEDLREEDNWLKIEPDGRAVEIAQFKIEVFPENEDE